MDGSRHVEVAGHLEAAAEIGSVGVAQAHSGPLGRHPGGIAERDAPGQEVPADGAGETASGGVDPGDFRTGALHPRQHQDLARVARRSVGGGDEWVLRPPAVALGTGGVAVVARRFAIGDGDVHIGVGGMAGQVQRQFAHQYQLATLPVVGRSLADRHRGAAGREVHSEPVGDTPGMEEPVVPPPHLFVIVLLEREVVDLQKLVVEVMHALDHVVSHGPASGCNLFDGGRPRIARRAASARPPSFARRPHELAFEGPDLLSRPRPVSPEQLLQHLNRPADPKQRVSEDRLLRLHFAETRLAGLELFLQERKPGL